VYVVYLIKNVSARPPVYNFFPLFFSFFLPSLFKITDTHNYKMSISPMDLDSSLDDLIRKRKQTHHKKPSNNNTNTNKRQQHSHSLHQQQNKPKSSLNIQTRAKITKPSQPQRSGINSRLV
jgi:hypothetical protein